MKQATLPVTSMSGMILFKAHLPLPVSQEVCEGRGFTVSFTAPRSVHHCAQHMWWALSNWSLKCIERTRKLLLFFSKRFILYCGIAD